MKAPVTERALLARINRKLEKEGSLIKKCRRNSRSWHVLGDYYEIDIQINGVVSYNVDLEDRARELGCLKGYENLEEVA